MFSHTLHKGGHLTEGFTHTLPGAGHARKPPPDPPTKLIFSNPAIQSFPETAAELAKKMAVSFEPDYIIPMQDLSGNQLDVVGDMDLSPVNSPLQGQTAPGIWDGSSYTSRRAVEFLGSSSAAWQSSDASKLDAASGGSISALVCFRAAGSVASDKQILAKTVLFAGWLLSLRSDGSLRATISDGVTGIAATVAGDHDDGAPHYAYVKIDRTANTISLTTDLGTDSADISLVGDASTAVGLAVGTIDALSSFPGQVLYFAGWDSSAAAEGIPTTAAAIWWEHASDPTGRLTTQTRLADLTVDVSPTHVATFAANTVPIGHSPASLNSRKLALYAPHAETEYCTHSEDFTDVAWVKNNVTPTGEFADAPNGFRRACKLTADADNGYVSYVFASVASTQYTVGVKIKEVTPGCTGRVILYNETGAAEVASTAFVATDEWDQFVQVTATTAVGQVSSSMRIEIDNNTESVLAWGANIRKGEKITDIIRTKGSAKNIFNPDFRVANIVPSRMGRVEAQASLECSKNTGQILFSTESTTDWRVVWHPAGHTTQFLYYNGSGSPWASMTGGVKTLGVSSRYVARWDIDDDGNFPEDSNRSASGHLDGSVQGTPQTTSSTLSEELRDLRIGANYNQTGGFCGFIESISISTKVGREP